MMRSRIIFRSVIIISCRADRSSIEVARSVHCVSVGMANCSFLRISWRCLLIWRSCAAVAVWLAAACSVSCCDSCAAVAACSVSCRDSCAVVAADRLAADCSASCRVAVACDSADRLAAGCSASCRVAAFSASCLASCAAVADRLAAASDSPVWLAACSASCRDSCAVVAADRLAADCSVSCRVAVACDSADRLAAACDISGFSGFSGYFSAIFVKRLLLLSSCWRRGRFSFSTVVVVDWAASFRFTVTGNSMKTFFGSMDIEEWR